MSITASEARRNLFPLIEQVNDDRTPVEIVSRRGNAVLMSAEEYAALAETAHLLRSPENARRLHTAYNDALARRNLIHRDLSDLEELADQACGNSPSTPRDGKTSPTGRSTVVRPPSVCSD